MKRQGMKAYIHYKGYLADNTEFDSNPKEEPFEFIIGTGSIMPGLEKALLDMEIGSEKTIALSSEEAYGEVNPEAIERFPVASLPNGYDLKEGMTIRLYSPRIENPAPAKVIKIEDGVVSLDFNHPLAGKDLTYWIKLVDLVDFA